MEPNAHNRTRIAAAGMVSIAAVRRYFAGLPVRSTTVARVRCAIALLGLPDREERQLDANPGGQRPGAIRTQTDKRAQKSG